MSDPIISAIKANELGGADPYALSFAGKGQSGASVGAFQTDLSTNPAALNEIWKALIAAGQAGPWATRTCALLSRPCRSNPLVPDDAEIVGVALHSAYGRSAIDGLDARALTAVTGRMEIVTKAYKLTVAAQCALACWVNMTGAPMRLRAWMDAGHATETPVTLTVMLDYLASTQFFSENPRNFDHFKQSLPVEDFTC